MDPKPRHPSERPIRRNVEKGMGYTRAPHDQPLTPGLRREAPVSAIGFLARLSEQSEE